jgi:hypothetical protein
MIHQSRNAPDSGMPRLVFNHQPPRCGDWSSRRE